MNRIRLGLIAAAIGAAFAQPASATVTVLNNKVTVSGTGGSFSVNFDGYNGNVLPGLTSKIDFTFVNITNGGKTFNFTYQLSNTTTITASRLSVFGLHTDLALLASTGTGANIQSPGASATAPFGVDVVGNPNLPNFAGPISVCFKPDGQLNNCNAGQGGVLKGATSAVGTFALNLQNSANQLVLDNFFVRYQSLSGAAGNANSAIGRGTVVVNAIPEPATWAMMIGGFGLLGTALRRRRSITAAALG